MITEKINGIKWKIQNGVHIKIKRNLFLSFQRTAFQFYTKNLNYIDEDPRLY